MSTTSNHRVLLVRLPCNPIFPIGPIYLADHLHKQFPQLGQRILDLAAVPVLDVERVLLQVITAFRPTLLVFSWPAWPSSTASNPCIPAPSAVSRAKVLAVTSSGISTP